MEIDAAHIDIWYIEPEVVANAERLGRLERWLDDEELARANRFRFKEHRDLYVVSHALLRGALTQCAQSQTQQINPADWRFKNNAFGKPFVEQPDPYQNIAFNLSHTEGLAAVAVSQAGRSGIEYIGVDVEPLSRKGLDLALARQFFSTEEIAAAAAITGAEQAIRLLEYWTLKESFIKAVGQGLSIPLESFAFRLGSDTTSPVLIRNDVLSATSTNWQFWQFQPTTAHVTALTVGTTGTHRPNVSIKRADWLL